MENYFYFALFWILTGLGNYSVFLIELKTKQLRTTKKFKRKIFWICFASGFVGVIVSAYTLIFPKK